MSAAEFKTDLAFRTPFPQMWTNRYEMFTCRSHIPKIEKMTDMLSCRNYRIGPLWVNTIFHLKMLSPDTATYKLNRPKVKVLKHHHEAHKWSAPEAPATPWVRKVDHQVFLHILSNIGGFSQLFHWRDVYKQQWLELCVKMLKCSVTIFFCR